MELHLTDAAVKLSLHLSYLRSLSAVGAALHRKFPTSEEWEQVRNTEDFIADMNHFAEVMDNIRIEMLKAENPEEVEEATLRLYDVAVDSLSVFAEKYDIPIEDLVYVMVH